MCAQAYIDFEIADGERDRTRALYERLLERTRHVKVRRFPFHIELFHIDCTKVSCFLPSQ